MYRQAARKSITVHTILIVSSLMMIFPFVWMILTSFKSVSETAVVPPVIFPEILRTENYTEMVRTLPFAAFYLNTILMIAGRIAGALVFSSMAGYAFGRMDFPLKNFLFLVVILQMMVPPQVYLIPQYMLMLKLGWLNTVKALIAPGIVSAFGTFLLRQFFMGIPREMEEAATIDGCHHGQIFLHTMVPQAHSGMVALGIFTALFAWKDLLWPLIVNMSAEKMTLSAGLASLQGQFWTNIPVMMAGAVLAVVPMLIIFLLFQRQFIQGIAMTGIKG